ncbi:hypothetical protein CEXT_3341 [Caerostris extrusa]|uniref:Uncharacterized protein n=1 Tax=Caerostris extrusa TaxID=172846 RepID=A0AAV4Y5L2_CAEEX|nr:hypothetical protein CEXT_3341 [Caerostris extrusa]
MSVVHRNNATDLIGKQDLYQRQHSANADFLMCCVHRTRGGAGKLISIPIPSDWQGRYGSAPGLAWGATNALKEHPFD